jgi:hypothetical protein
VDVIFAASTDLSSFTGWKQEDPRYEALVTRIHDATLKAGKVLAGPLAWRNRPGYTFFQAPKETVLVKLGAQATLAVTPPTAKKGIAPTEGSEK